MQLQRLKFLTQESGLKLQTLLTTFTLNLIIFDLSDLIFLSHFYKPAFASCPQHWNEIQNRQQEEKIWRYEEICHQFRELWVFRKSSIECVKGLELSSQSAEVFRSFLFVCFACLFFQYSNIPISRCRISISTMLGKLWTKIYLRTATNKGKRCSFLWITYLAKS